MRYFLLIILCSCSFIGVGQWNNNPSVNNAISRSEILSEVEPVSVTDGAGGSIILFMDVNSGELYAQRMNADGMIVWGDTTHPVIVTNDPGTEYKHKAVADGNGGMYIAWIDFRDDPLLAEVYMQHIDGAGTILWENAGRRVTTTADFDETDVFMCTDSVGGVIVAWNWDNYISNKLVSAQRFDAAGNAVWGIPGEGLRVCEAPGFRWTNNVTSDGRHGAIFLFTDTRNDPNGTDYFNYSLNYLVNADLYAQRLDSNGIRLWADTAVAVCKAFNNQYTDDATVVNDGSGGGIFVFNDARNNPGVPNDPLTNGDIYTQRIDQNGVVQWAADGMAATTAAGNQYNRSVCIGPAGGAVITWEDEATLGIMGQSFSAAGTALWGTGGIPVSAADEFAYNPLVIATNNSQFVFVYESLSIMTSFKSIRAQKLNTAGLFQWDIAGVPVANNPDATPSAMKAITNGDSAVIVSWEDYRNMLSSPDIYASKLLPGGVLEGEYITIADGNWNTPSIWRGGTVPPPDAKVTIRHIVNITEDAACYSLKIEEATGFLTVKSGVSFTIMH